MKVKEKKRSLNILARENIEQLLQEIETSEYKISNGPLTDEDLKFLEEKFDSILCEYWSNDDPEACAELALLYAQSRAFSDPIKVLSSGLLYYGTKRFIPDDDILEEYGIELRKVRKNGISPIMIKDDELARVAEKMADIIDANNRAPVEFIELSSRYKHSIGDPDFKTLCERDFLFIDPGTASKQNGALTKEEAANVIDTKIKCSHCPLKDLCLATSLASPQTTRMSQKERTIPNPASEILTVVDYLMFGGYTPQERRLIFNKVCTILENRDREKRNLPPLDN